MEQISIRNWLAWPLACRLATQILHYQPSAAGCDRLGVDGWLSLMLYRSQVKRAAKDTDETRKCMFRYFASAMSTLPKRFGTRIQPRRPTDRVCEIIFPWPEDAG